MDDSRMERMERRMDDLDKRESAMERAMDSAMARSRQAMGVLVPADTRKHVRASWRHNLLALRSMIDHWATQLDDGTDEHPADSSANGSGNGSGRQNIPIE
jgi:hypothetical protein